MNWTQTIVVLCGFSLTKIALAFPTVCSVVKTPAFDACMSLNVSMSVCGYPPRACAHFNYFVPQYYIEVVRNPGDSYFTGLPGAAMQLGGVADRAPFGSEDDTESSFSFHGHTLIVPFISTLKSLPCDGIPEEMTCLSGMSEHLGQLWKTGSADATQPQFLAWSAAPKACLLAGAATSISGGSYPTGYPSSGGCSADRSSMDSFPPSSQPVCTGWGVHFPRYGTVTNADQVTASLVIASRMRSLSSEVFQTIPTSANEKWQMIHPQSSTCFAEGQNIAFLRANGVNEIGRLSSLESRNYLYVVWKHVSCTKDVPYVASIYAALAAIRAACQGLE